MGQIDYINQGQYDDVLRRLRALETQSPLERSSVTNGRVRFIGGELRIDSGGRVTIEGTLEVNGTSTVTGSFTVAGPIDLAGAVTISGDTTVTGDMTVTGKLTQNGPWEFDGNGDITGDVDVAGTISVDGTGRVAVGTAMQLTPAVDGGALVFQGDVNQKVYGNGSAVGMRKGSNSISVGDTLAGILVGSRSLNVSTTGYQATNMPTINRTTIGSPPVGTVYADASGNLYRAV